MKKGFTLIELLAVIVILTIIALIATPIILGIINDARKESNERSVELYASAVRNAIASYQLTNPNAPETFEDLDVQYDGEVVCAIEELYADGSFYITGCTVNGTEVDYTYGEQQVTQPTRFYSWSSGKIGEILPSDAKTTVEELNTNYPFYLALDVDSSNKVVAAYSCFIKNETEYCLKGYDTEAYDTNYSVLESADFVIKSNDNGLLFYEDVSPRLCAEVTTNGSVYTYEKLDGSIPTCDVMSNGNFYCRVDTG